MLVKNKVPLPICIPVTQLPFGLLREMRFRVLDHAVFPTHVHTEQLKTEALGLPLESFVLRLSQNHTGHATAFILAPHTTTR